jgi:hypothetical protein
MVFMSDCAGSSPPESSSIRHSSSGSPAYWDRSRRRSGAASDDPLFVAARLGLGAFGALWGALLFYAGILSSEGKLVARLKHIYRLIFDNHKLLLLSPGSFSVLGDLGGEPCTTAKGKDFRLAIGTQRIAFRATVSGKLIAIASRSVVVPPIWAGSAPQVACISEVPFNALRG